MNLGDLFRRDRDPNQVALIDLGGYLGSNLGENPVSELAPREFTYGQLDEMANAVARGLEAQALPAGTRVAILSANRAEFIACLFGIMRAGLVAVPVNYKFPQKMIDFVLADSGAQLVFCDALRACNAPVTIPKIVFDQNDSEGFDGFINPGPYSSIIPKPDQVAMILYTSGSSGKPKGVMLSHQSHVWVAKTRLGKNNWSHHRFLIAAPLYHMNALALTKLAILAHAQIILLPQFDAKQYIKATEKYRCTWLTAVPPMIAMMLQETELLKSADLSSVEFLRMGSAPISPKLLAAIHEALPHTKVTNAFGTTEAGPVVFGVHPNQLEQPTISVGYPHPEVELRLVDENNLPADQGILQMKSPGVMLGYHQSSLRDPLPHPFTPDGFYSTGDLFTKDENGFYYFIGRSDDMFVCGGENIYPTEVERLLESHPDVEAAAVVPVEDYIKGQKPAAYVVKKQNSTITESEIKTFCLENGPAYQHPRWVVFLDALPLASTNKIDRIFLKNDAKNNLANRD